MGNLRVPKEIYIKQGVIKFFAKNKQVYYKILIWSDDGLTQFPLKVDKLETSVDELVAEVKRGLPSFTNERK